MKRSKTAGRRQRDARLSIKNSINHALFIYRHPKRKVNARQRPIRGAFVYQRPTGEGLACQPPYAKDLFAASCAGRLLASTSNAKGLLASTPYAKGIFATSCAGHLLASILREALVTSTSYARCLQTHRTRSAGKRPVREVLASSPYTRCLKRPICRAYEAHPRIPGTNTKDAAGGTLLPGQTAKETAGALLVGQAPPPRNP